MIKHKLIKMMVAVGLILATSVTTAFAATTGWAKLGNSYGYKDSNGQYVKGWQEINGKWYYFSDSFSAVKGYRPTGPDRVYYHFNDDWSWDGGRTYSAEEATRLDAQGTSPVTKGIPIGQQQATGNQTQQSAVNQTQAVETEPQLSEEEFHKSVEKESLILVNKHRKNNGLAEFEWSDELAKSAKWKSTDMINRNYFAHNWDGIWFTDIVKEGCGIEISSENLSGSYVYSPTNLTENSAKALALDLFNRWKNSPGHNKQMISTSYSEFGFEFDYGYYTPNKGDMIFAAQHFR